MLSRVTVVMTARGHISAIYADPAEAAKQVQAFNADPFLEPGQPDPDAPYEAVEWGLCDRPGDPWACPDHAKVKVDVKEGRW
jgi:hypothetical protein